MDKYADISKIHTPVEPNVRDKAEKDQCKTGCCGACKSHLEDSTVKRLVDGQQPKS